MEPALSAIAWPREWMVWRVSSLRPWATTGIDLTIPGLPANWEIGGELALYFHLECMTPGDRASERVRC